MIEHMSACKHQDRDQTPRHPQVAVIQDRHDVSGQCGNDGHDAENYCTDAGDPGVVDRTLDRRFGALGEVSRHP